MSLLPQGSKISIESREGVRIKPTIQYFGKENTIVEQFGSPDYRLKIGDEYVVGIEYKTIGDLVSSIMSGHIFKQVNTMQKIYKDHYLFIEGGDIDDYLDSMRYWKKNIYFTKKNWNGFISGMVQETKIIIIKDYDEALEMMELCFKKSTDGKNHCRVPIRKLDNPAMTYINGIDNIGEDTAKLVSDELELKNLNDLLGLDKDSLLSLKGVGNKTAESILGAIG
ncbi:ERCC4 domain-containing protein [Methanobrevibacter arboriphilus]|uniref:ERCC4 domain-containing protein n=1 Tax=Methanobrevibacter arboriphilus TaxID=39441 RepID=UPI0006D0FDE9|nr:ERCC4 domain-containing protein [Methanobrevibacter arboriphilus]